MKGLSFLTTVLLVGSGVLGSTTLGAQTAARPDNLLPQGESYGPDTNYLIIPATAFVPDRPDAVPLYSFDGYLTPTSTIGTYIVGADLPAGAQVLNVCGFIYDVDPLGEVVLYWRVVEMGDSGVAPIGKHFGIVSTGRGDTPGYSMTCLGRNSETLIRKFQDVDGDGHSGYSWYQIAVQFNIPVATGKTQFGGVLIKWKRTISAPPRVATFGDVPTDYVYFKAIEALAASGIAGGCGNGNFCPTQNVTRGEMAAFLARALGLHWPL